VSFPATISRYAPRPVISHHDFSLRATSCHFPPRFLATRHVVSFPATISRYAPRPVVSRHDFSLRATSCHSPPRFLPTRRVVSFPATISRYAPRPVILMASSMSGMICVATPSGILMPYVVMGMFVGFTGLSILLLFNPELLYIKRSNRRLL
jgi:hypothetical protein